MSRMDDLDVDEDKIPWPHAPAHHLSEKGTYFVTSSTYRKEHHFRGAKRLVALQRGLLKLCDRYEWKLEAWAIFSNHYHFVAQSPRDNENAESLRPMLAELHAKSAAWVNRFDGSPGRRVWHNFWEARLTFQKAYLARLNYVNQNPVKHRLVPVAIRYSWSWAGWFERTATEAFVKSVYRFKIDTVHVEDNHVPSEDW